VIQSSTQWRCSQHCDELRIQDCFGKETVTADLYSETPVWLRSSGSCNLWAAFSGPAFSFFAAPGHRDELEKSLGQPGSGTAGNVLLQHLEGTDRIKLVVSSDSTREA
jgi:hypothetical protein